MRQVAVQYHSTDQCGSLLQYFVLDIHHNNPIKLRPQKEGKPYKRGIRDQITKYDTLIIVSERSTTTVLSSVDHVMPF